MNLYNFIFEPPPLPIGKPAHEPDIGVSRYGDELFSTCSKC